jgi:hypothetical protein
MTSTDLTEETRMKCPTCPDTRLVMSERQGVEIDYCPNCRGIWLDRGELDKLLDRAAAQAPQAAPPSAERRQDAAWPPRGYEQSHPGTKRYHKQKSWLSEIFD